MNTVNNLSFVEEWLNLSHDQLLQELSKNYSVDEETWVKRLIAIADPASKEMLEINATARPLIEKTRKSTKGAHIVDKLLQEYSLSDEDGITLMCLSEALLRVPDAATRNALIKDKLTAADWKTHLDSDNSLFVNASTWGLLIAGRFVKSGAVNHGDASTGLQKLLYKCGASTLRGAMKVAMQIIGEYFVLGRTIQEASKRSIPFCNDGCKYSFDMLGEAAHTRKDAERYLNSYLGALDNIAKNAKSRPETGEGHTLSIKISALHPRYEESHRESTLPELVAIVNRIVEKARACDIGITIDAEEADRLELSLELFKQVYTSDVARGWGNFGLVVQAYSKRALHVLCWITSLSASQGDEIPVRLVKGAYWDTEIKLCQELGFDSYPVFTRKESTDTSYLACARYLLSDYTKGCIYPQFASHNAQTIASVLAMAGERHFEFQRLHGMGEGLYETVMQSYPNVGVRIYAPVGSHEDLLPYLVRRLLENGANGSFVHKLQDANVPVDELIVHPTKLLMTRPSIVSPYIPLPGKIFNDRDNSKGINLHIASQREPLMNALDKYKDTQWLAKPILGSDGTDGGASKVVDVHSPYDNSQKVGSVLHATPSMASDALVTARESFDAWSLTDVSVRAAALDKTAALLEDNRDELMALCVREAGKTLDDSIDEIREAVDFCRYYAQQARGMFTEPRVLPGPTGELNELHYEGRGVFVCISPWNFPLAIFMGQVVAAIVAGNTVIAKPAEQTSLIAFRAAEMMHEAGIPKGVLQFLPGSGAELGGVLMKSSDVAGVAFTGSTPTGRLINNNLANRESAIATLVAETGGLNAMLVDSTALPEQVATDVIRSAFSSAGQRCSALRVLYVQDDIADRVIELVKGSMDELKLGFPGDYSTDMGPVIDKAAQDNLLSYIEEMKGVAKQSYQGNDADGFDNGTFVPPTLLEIDSITQLKDEKFGPILHVARYAAADMDKVIADINGMQFGLTLGIHSRNITTYQYIAKRVRVGNVYINRNQVGAMVGVNPFGGRGLSGTGPKAGGPNYLTRFITEKTISLNTAAIGGNASLLSPETQG
jgi:RHH-type proline utilization regulon transcriptional repressor/proline dehydrogenase/delta 1-pyrroline-5-carboxylate dehydrogenase